MFGNVLTNRQLRTLLDEKRIRIKDFNPLSLKQASYTLNPARVLKQSSDGEWEVVHSFTRARPTFLLQEHEYVVVEPRQDVVIDVDGVIGTFVQASTNIEAGILVVAGQIDSGYGSQGESLRFGVKNLLDKENALSIDTRLVHVQFVDMRGSSSDPVKRSEEQEKVHAARRRGPADDDGPLHEFNKFKD